MSTYQKINYACPASGSTLADIELTPLSKFCRILPVIKESTQTSFFFLHTQGTYNLYSFSPPLIRFVIPTDPNNPLRVVSRLFYSHLAPAGKLFLFSFPVTRQRRTHPAMSAAVTNPLPQPDAKGAKKKRAKGENSSTVSGAVTDPPNPATPTTESAPNGVAGAHEPGFLKDLHKYTFWHPTSKKNFS